MTARSRLLLVAAALILVPVFFTPLWSVTLVAPQYPEGLGMNIHVNEIRPHEEHDLQNINILNHYIGMQPIEPDAIPELEIMPWILGFFVVFGLVGAATGSRLLLGTWFVLFLIAGAAGMVDFYLWKYEYGHNLSPDAPIKVPGQSYMPPIIGTKQILNITATSLPSWGTLFLGLATVSGGASCWREWKARGEEES